MTFYAGGGGGGGKNGGGAGGAGGGGAGGHSGVSFAMAGLDNTGGGGGGGAFENLQGDARSNGGAGGSGIVMVRYRLDSMPPTIENRPATNITSASAWLNGYLPSIGGAPSTVSVYWGTGDGGAPTSGLWQTTNTWAEGAWDEGSFPTFEATGLTENMIYYYRFYAASADGHHWPAASASFVARSGVSATGGDLVQHVSDYRIHVFTNENVNEYYFEVSSAGNTEVLVVGGGGGGGATMGGGGGGGGVLYEDAYVLTAGVYSVKIGAGGLGGFGYNNTTLPLQAGVKGGDSSFGENLVATGGGGGAGWSGHPPTSGGSGGGGNPSTTGVPPGSGTPDQGHGGGAGDDTSGQRSGGGGGGASAVGGDGTANAGGTGGAGREIFGIYYGGGGGGGVEGAALQADGGGSGGTGGGGAGSRGTTHAIAGAPTTGGGGGGAGYDTLRFDNVRIGGKGGSGIVLVRYAYPLLAVESLPAAPVGVTDATLNGRVGGFGGNDAPDVYVCFGTTDAQPFSTSAWERVVYLGNDWTKEQQFSHEISGLDGKQTYVYRIYARNGIGANTWSEPQSFTTYDKPTVIQHGAADILKYSARLLGEVTDTGGEMPMAGFEWWPVGGSETSSVAVGYAGDAFEATATDLIGGQTYAYRAWASNTVAGVGHSSEGVFETRAAGAEVYTWTGAIDIHWPTIGNWTNAGGNPGVPEAGDTAIINTGSVRLSATTPVLAEVRVSNATLTFANWMTALEADTVIVENGGTLTLPGAFTNSGMSNRVWVVCHDFTLSNGGVINVNARGFQKFNGPGAGDVHLPRGGNHGGAGGGYGGWGGEGSGGAVSGAAYGYADAPEAPGSGGGGYSLTHAHGADGGGAVRIAATGTVIVDGDIFANGGSLSGTGYGAGGAGGGVWISCDTFGGTGGRVFADGGNGHSAGGMGGGGRIAVTYNQLVGTPSVSFSANRGTAGVSPARDLNMPTYRRAAHIGSLYFSDPGILNGLLLDEGTRINGLNGYLLFANSGGLPASLRKFSQSTIGVGEGQTMEFPQGLTSDGGGIMVREHAELISGGDLVLTNSARLVVYSGVTNGVDIVDGAVVRVGGTLAVHTGSTIVPFAHSTNGSTVRFEVGALTVAAGGVIDANAAGYRDRFGPGKGGDSTSGAGGGSYGGRGGRANSGNTYGDPLMPVEPGSGGGRYGSTHSAFAVGGGGIRVHASGPVEINGTLTANGQSHANVAGAGSGGGIYITCASIAVSQGAVLRANGGTSGSSGGGGGGRIAIVYGAPFSLDLPERRLVITEEPPASIQGTVQALAGTGGSPAPGNGTVRYMQVLPLQGTIIMFR